ncbi:hypothetical protein ACHAPU_001995 [Fusarium lateritium]
MVATGVGVAAEGDALGRVAVTLIAVAVAVADVAVELFAVVDMVVGSEPAVATDYVDAGLVEGVVWAVFAGAGWSEQTEPVGLLIEGGASAVDSVAGISSATVVLDGTTAAAAVVVVVVDCRKDNQVAAAADAAVVAGQVDGEE